MFSSTVLDHWVSAATTTPAPDGSALVRVDPSIGDAHSVSLLRIVDGGAVLSLSPVRAAQLGLAADEVIGLDDLADRLEAAGIALNDPDHLFYLDVTAQASLLDEVAAAGVRALTVDDAAAFARFVAEAPDDDLDEAYVELDHWLVFGSFDGDRLVAAASMYPWDGTRLADLGVITLPDARGRGWARATVRAIGARALELGFEPQYRCQLDNAPSVALAAAAGFTRFGEWEVVIGGE